MNNLLCFLHSIVQYLIQHWIALVALVFSYLNYRRGNQQIELVPDTQAEWILSVVLDNGESIVNPNGMLKINIKIINPSNIDVNFFDLIVFDKNREYQYYYRRQNNIINDLTGRNAVAAVAPSGNIVLVEIPEADYGILKAHSMTRLSLIIQASEMTDKLFVAFKIAKRKPFFKTTKFGYINSPYQSFSASFPVELSKKPNYEEVLKALYN